MANRTVYRDNPESGLREAWQNGTKVYEWTQIEIAKMHAEVPTIPEWGGYAADTPIPAPRRARINPKHA